MYEVSIQAHFSAAHRLRGYRGSCEALHGHNWDVEVAVRGRQLNRTGILVDFRDLKRLMKRLLRELDHKDLNAVRAFRRVNPTSENIARHLFEQVARGLARTDCRVAWVRVHETPSTSATYREEDPD